MELTPEDLKREIRIAELGAAVVYGEDPRTRAAMLQVMMKEIQARSPAAVAVIEKQQGLA